MIATFKTILHNLQLKVTPARLGVLDLLAKSDKPVDVDYMVSVLEEEGIDADRATVYRILEIFLEKGVVNRFEFQEGKFRYELAGTDHHHLVCEQCGAIEDISDCNIDKLEKEIRKKKGFLVKRHALEFFGICKQCQR